VGERAANATDLRLRLLPDLARAGVVRGPDLSRLAVVAVGEGELTAMEPGGPDGECLQRGPVVRDEDARAPEALERGDDEGPALRVEVVGRLVEEENAWLPSEGSAICQRRRSPGERAPALEVVAVELQLSADAQAGPSSRRARERTSSPGASTSW
jgi:hypothetical protein